MALKASPPRPTLANSSGSVSGFRRVNGDRPKPRLIVMAKAREKFGKTHFGFTAPPPLYYHSIDIGDEGVIEKFAGDKEIYKSEYRVVCPDGQDIEAVSRTATETLTRFKADYIGALKAGASVVIDTQDELWELIRLAHFGKLDQVQARYYGPANREMREIINMAYEADCNLVLPTKLKDEYVNDKRTGKDKPAGWADMPYSAQVVVLCNKVAGEYTITVESCRQRPDLEGMELPCDFDALFQMVNS